MTVPVSPTMPCPDIQQPIARFDDRIKKWMCDPIWYRFFRSPQFVAASIGGATGQGANAGVSTNPTPIATTGTAASAVLTWLSFY